MFEVICSEVSISGAVGQVLYFSLLTSGAEKTYLLHKTMVLFVDTCERAHA